MYHFSFTGHSSSSSPQSSSIIHDDRKHFSIPVRGQCTWSDRCLGYMNDMPWSLSSTGSTKCTPTWNTHRKLTKKLVDVAWYKYNHQSYADNLKFSNCTLQSKESSKSNFNNNNISKYHFNMYSYFLSVNFNFCALFWNMYMTEYLISDKPHFKYQII